MVQNMNQSKTLVFVFDNEVDSRITHMQRNTIPSVEKTRIRIYSFVVIF